MTAASQPKGIYRGVVRGIAHRPNVGDPMVVAHECRVLAHRGIDVENRKPGRREVTFLSAETWVNVCRELGTDLPWHMRRANFLVEGLDLPATVGATVRIGEVRVRIHGESKPCELMDRSHPGLREALRPNGRGGVYGEVLTGGFVRVADGIEAESPRR